MVSMSACNASALERTQAAEINDLLRHTVFCLQHLLHVTCVCVLFRFMSYNPWRHLFSFLTSHMRIKLGLKQSSCLHCNVIFLILCQSKITASGRKLRQGLLLWRARDLHAEGSWSNPQLSPTIGSQLEVMWKSVQCSLRSWKHLDQA